MSQDHGGRVSGFEIAGLDLTAERRAAIATAYRDVETALAVLRRLDLTDVPPMIIFDPMLPYRPGGKS
ncbi:MAG: hypothetical protein P4M00_12170 [Azospirillaceae bacterium]|nr:hypothetical protein [Azospirillaceae bacterium]